MNDYGNYYLIHNSFIFINNKNNKIIFILNIVKLQLINELH